MKYLLDSTETVEINNKKYYLRIRLNNLDNPVVLFLHGGVGSPDRFYVMKCQSPLAGLCTLIAWDQPGSGLAYDSKLAKTEKLTMEGYIEDTHIIIDYLKERFNKDKIIIVGHSFGSALAVLVAQKYPEDIQAYVGIGQLVEEVENEKISYNFVMAEAKRRGDKKGIKQLEELGAPVDGLYKNNKIMLQRSYLHKYGGAVYNSHKSYWKEIVFDILPLMRKEYSLRGIVKYVKGVMYCINSPIAKQKNNFFESVKKLEMPVYLMLGHHDYNCSFELAERWFNMLEAPEKKLIWFEQSAHSPQWEESDLWNEQFAKFVLNKEL